MFLLTALTLLILALVALGVGSSQWSDNMPLALLAYGLCGLLLLGAARLEPRGRSSGPRTSPAAEASADRSPVAALLGVSAVCLGAGVGGVLFMDIPSTTKATVVVVGAGLVAGLLVLATQLWRARR